ncbi:MAG: hypothetical protein ACI4PG_05510, partial [Candidatus Ventricola sp.]
YARQRNKRGELRKRLSFLRAMSERTTVFAKRSGGQESGREQTTSSDLAPLGHLPLWGRLIRLKRGDKKQWFGRKPV